MTMPTTTEAAPAITTGRRPEEVAEWITSHFALQYAINGATAILQTELKLAAKAKGYDLDAWFYSAPVRATGLRGVSVPLSGLEGRYPSTGPCYTLVPESSPEHP